MDAVWGANRGFLIKFTSFFLFRKNIFLRAEGARENFSIFEKKDKDFGWSLYRNLF